MHYSSWFGWSKVLSQPTAVGLEKIGDEELPKRISVLCRSTIADTVVYTVVDCRTMGMLVLRGLELVAELLVVRSILPFFG